MPFVYMELRTIQEVFCTRNKTRGSSVQLHGEEVYFLSFFSLFLDFILIIQMIQLYLRSHTSSIDICMQLRATLFVHTDGERIAYQQVVHQSDDSSLQICHKRGCLVDLPCPPPPCPLNHFPRDNAGVIALIIIFQTNCPYDCTSRNGVCIGRATALEKVLL
jgi:hypothetical protein